MKAFTRRSVLDGLESRKLPIVVMNMATVDDPGMIVCSPNCILSPLAAGRFSG